MKIKVYRTESYSTWVTREPVEIDTNDYPELEGMSKEEIEDYVKSNSYEMKPTNDEYWDSLEMEINESDVRREKITDDDYGMIVEFDEE